MIRVIVVGDCGLPVEGTSEDEWGTNMCQWDYGELGTRKGRRGTVRSEHWGWSQCIAEQIVAVWDWDTIGA